MTPDAKVLIVLIIAKHVAERAAKASTQNRPFRTDGRL